MAAIAAKRLVEVGVSYCVQHHGIANEDDYECDYKQQERGRSWAPAPFPCKLRSLVYVKPERRRG